MPPVPSRLDPRVGERCGSPLAGATVATRGGTGGSGRRASLGQRSRTIPPEPAERFQRLPGGRRFGLRSLRDADARSVVRPAVAPGFPRTGIDRGRFGPPPGLAPARQLLRGADPLAVLPGAALRSRSGHGDPPLPAQPVPGVLGRHPLTAGNRPSDRRRRSRRPLLLRGQRAAGGVGACRTRHVRCPRRDSERRVGGALRGARRRRPPRRPAARHPRPPSRRGGGARRHRARG